MRKSIGQLLLLVFVDIRQLPKNRITRGAAERSIRANRYQASMPFGCFLESKPECLVSR